MIVYNIFICLSYNIAVMPMLFFDPYIHFVCAVKGKRLELPVSRSPHSDISSALIESG